MPAIIRVDELSAAGVTPTFTISIQSRENRMKKIHVSLAIAVIALSSTVLHAENDAEVAIRAAIEKVSQGSARPDSIRPSRIKGLYEVVLGTEVIYVTADGRYLLNGDLLDVQQRRNISDERRAVLYKNAIDKLDEGSMIVYAPKETRHTVTVFTDIDCPYCRKMHHEMAEYNKAGIKIRYLAFPRAGIGSDSYNKTVSVWCADDRATALTRAKNGEQIKKASCDNPVREHLDLVKQLGVNATPTLFLEDGRRIPGYVPAERLINMLEQGR